MFYYKIDNHECITLKKPFKTSISHSDHHKTFNVELMKQPVKPLCISSYDIQCHGNSNVFPLDLYISQFIFSRPLLLGSLSKSLHELKIHMVCF